MDEWECSVCGHLHDGEEPPATCPECGAPKSRYVFYAYADDDEWDEDLDDEDDEFDEDWSTDKISGGQHVGQVWPGGQVAGQV
jgi:rubredoxin